MNGIKEGKEPRNIMHNRNTFDLRTLAMSAFGILVGIFAFGIFLIVAGGMAFSIWKNAVGVDVTVQAQDFSNTFFEGAAFQCNKRDNDGDGFVSCTAATTPPTPFECSMWGNACRLTVTRVNVNNTTIRRH